ncbi:MAG: hypothetical protein KAR44_13935 [Candidatus Aegiribacteria sp.]|nr:hypothetical protein [Candidatus Aegiribacteria sp.]
MNKIVVRYADGKIQKGFTSDFSPNRAMFHLTGISDQKTEVIYVNKLKAVFIVKEFEGDPHYRKDSDFDDSQQVYGAKLRIHFSDGEKLVGVGMGYKPDKIGFFLTPCDPDSNTIRAFVVNECVDHVEKL